MSTLYQRISDKNQPIVIIAEMAWAHDGSLEKAKKIVKGAFDAGADAINFHLTHLEDYMVMWYGLNPGILSSTDSNKESVYKYLEKINLSFSQFKELSDFAHALGLFVSIMCNDQESLDFSMKQINPEMLMIHPSCITDSAFVASVAAAQKPLVLYCGGLFLGEIERAIEICKTVGNERLILQHGFQSYPTHIADNHLRYIETLNKIFGYPISFGDHTDGADPFALIVPLLSIPYGVRVIEKHITFDRAEKGEDYESALDPSQFKVFREYVRKTESTLGSSSWKSLSERENTYRKVVRKRAIAKRNLTAGDVLNVNDVIYMRADNGLYPEEIDFSLGQVKLSQDIKKGMPITWDLFR